MLHVSVVEWVYRGTAVRKIECSGPGGDFFRPNRSTDGPSDFRARVPF